MTRQTVSLALRALMLMGLFSRRMRRDSPLRNRGACVTLQSISVFASPGEQLIREATVFKTAEVKRQRILEGEWRRRSPHSQLLGLAW